MNRPILFITAAYIGGIIIASLTGINHIVAFIITLAALTTYLILHKKEERLIFLLFACLGMLTFSFTNGYFAPNHIKNFTSDEKDLFISAVVASDPEISDDRAYFYAEVRSISDKATTTENMTGMVRVTLEKTIAALPKYGDEIIIKGKLRSPEKPRNPGEFDYRRYLSLRRVYYTVYAKDTACELTGKNSGNWFFRLSYAAKEKLLSIIYSSLPADEARILDGLMLGNQRAIPDDVYDRFKTTGTVHILAVSGMNVGMIGFVVFLLLKLMRVNRKICAAITMVLITGFMIITGAGGSIIRATIMSYAILIGILIERDVDVYTSLSAAAFFILLFNPASLFDPGFQMSFLATAGIVYFIDWFGALFPKMPAWLKDTLATTAAAQIFLTPVMVNTFHQLSLISVLANMIIVPLSGTISTLGYFMWLFGLVSATLAKVLGASIWALIRLMMGVVDLMAMAPYAAISVKTLPWIYVVFYYIVFLSLPYRDVDVRVKKLSLKYAGLAVICAWSILHVTIPGPSALSVPALKGINAAMVQTKENKKILVIGNDNFKSGKAVRSSLVPVLRYLGINNIDTLVAYGLTQKTNADAVMRNFHVISVYADKESQASFEKAGVIDGEFYFKEGHSAFININQDRADITQGTDEMIISRNIPADIAKRQGAVIYPFEYDDKAICELARNNKVITNSLNSGTFRKKPAPACPGIWDAGEKGMYYLLLK